MGDIDALKIWSLAQKYDHTDPEFVAALDAAEARADSPLSAVAMREKSAQHCLAHPDDYPHVNRGMDYSDGYMDSCKNASAIIRALPLPTPAELLAAAGELAEVRALVDAATPYASPVKNADFGRAVLQYNAMVAALAPFARKGE